VQEINMRQKDKMELFEEAYNIIQTIKRKGVEIKFPGQYEKTYSIKVTSSSIEEIIISGYTSKKEASTLKIRTVAPSIEDVFFNNNTKSHLQKMNNMFNAIENILYNEY
jgi:L-serine deaminase